jgi:prepilin-type N-terminal cleavage/methylation domain-containing protein/prepilin-type processing-associated H-X9-DG protein
MKRNIVGTAKQRGFTLIELLVVIAIIAILASILFPVFARARENARRSACQSNLKQIGLGIMQYTQDYDEKMPAVVPDVVNFGAPNAAPSIQTTVQPYIKSMQLFRCPSAVIFASSPPNDLSSNSYITNGIICRPTGLAMAAIPTVSELIIVHETGYLYNYAAADPQRVPATSNNFAYWLYPPLKYSETHFDGGNLLYADGHVKWRKQSSIAASEFGLDSTIVGPPANVNQTQPCQDWAKI